MKLNYVKLSKTLYKFFYENNNKYGEFYLDLNPDMENKGITGTAELTRKDPEYAFDLLEALYKELNPKKIKVRDMNGNVSEM